MNCHHEDRESRETNWTFISSMILFMMALRLMAYSPEICSPDDPYQMIRYGFRLLLGGTIAGAVFPAVFKIFDKQFEGSITEILSENPVALAVVVAALLGACAYVLANL